VGQQQTGPAPAADSHTAADPHTESSSSEADHSDSRRRDPPRRTGDNIEEDVGSRSSGLGTDSFALAEDTDDRGRDTDAPDIRQDSLEQFRDLPPARSY
jgi:hypothetical protein